MPGVWSSDFIVRILKFGSVGVVNTIIGFGVILLAMTAFKIPPVWSNVIGYACGLSVSFVLNSRFTFSDRGRPGWGAVFKFLTAFAIAYGLNISTLILLLMSGRELAVIAQLIAMCVYTFSFFLLSHFFVFRGLEK